MTIQMVLPFNSLHASCKPYSALILWKPNTIISSRPPTTPISTRPYKPHPSKKPTSAIPPLKLQAPETDQQSISTKHTTHLVEAYHQNRKLKTLLQKIQRKGSDPLQLLKEEEDWSKEQFWAVMRLLKETSRMQQALQNMARLPLARKKKIVSTLVIYMDILNKMLLLISLIFILIARRRFRRNNWVEQSLNRFFIRAQNINRMIYESDTACYEQLRMDRHTFKTLCNMLRTIGGLKDNRNMGVEEMVAMFLHIIAHHMKNRVVKMWFVRSGETISRQFNSVLHSVLRLHGVLFKKPEPVLESSTDDKWKWFKNCLGALDGTYIRVHVPEVDKPRYRCRRTEIATNVLGVCSQDMQFIYVLPGWEGSAHDTRVLRDAISRRNGLRVPQGQYYLCDAGYTNGDGFLTPYRGQRYHLDIWKRGYQPTTPKEYFNMKHSQARNVIERCFGLLKKRWAILRSPSFYPVKTQCRIITACCLLQNLIRREMPVDPMENELEEYLQNSTEVEGDRITYVEPSNAWSDWRDNLATEMFNEWKNSTHGE